MNIIKLYISFLIRASLNKAVFQVADLYRRSLILYPARIYLDSGKGSAAQFETSSIDNRQCLSDAKCEHSIPNTLSLLFSLLVARTMNPDIIGKPGRDKDDYNVTTIELDNLGEGEKTTPTEEDFDPYQGIPFPPIPGVTDKETTQLTIRSLLFGALIGCLAAASNTYLGLMIGWGFGASMLAAMVGFAAMKAVARLPEKLGGGFFGPKENVSLQTSCNATASGTSIFVAAYSPHFDVLMPAYQPCTS
jgi:hypothetical protein